MKVEPSLPQESGLSRMGDWSLNLLHTRPKLVVAMSEHDRLGLVLEAASYALKEVDPFEVSERGGAEDIIKRGSTED